MKISNYGLLDPIPSEPAGYVSKDEMWAAIPFGKKFMILHNGQQIHVSNNYKMAKDYILKQIKANQKKLHHLKSFCSVK